MRKMEFLFDSNREDQIALRLRAIETLKKLVENGLLVNCSFTYEDINAFKVKKLLEETEELPVYTEMDLPGALRNKG